MNKYFVKYVDETKDEPVIRTRFFNTVDIEQAWAAFVSMQHSRKLRIEEITFLGAYHEM